MTDQHTRSIDDCVPYFRDDRSQIRFEFAYLALTFVTAVGLLLIVNAWQSKWEISQNTRTLLCAAVGGFLGGWAYDAKWFYRVTARGRRDQYPFHWQRHKFYWRLLIPFVAGAVAFAIYVLVSSGVLPIVVADRTSARASFGICFFLAFFSDLALSRVARWVEGVLPKPTDKSTPNEPDGD